MNLPADLDRDGAVRWAVIQARLIVVGEFNDEPLGVFMAAQRMEWVLTRYTWTDDDYPSEVNPFVFGWNVSGPAADTQIREAAKALAAVDA